MKTSPGFCNRCGPVLAQKETPNHVLHFLIGMFTCGAWWVVWAILAAEAHGRAFRCPRCGAPATL